MKRRICITLPFALCVSTAALAKPTIYKGTLGKHEIVVEFSDDIAKAKEPVAGRYFYPAQGVDIPLDPVSAGSGQAELDEEKPCDRKTCTVESGANITKAPVNARWKLTAFSDGANLEGTWKPQKGQSLPIKLQRVANRSFGESYDQLTPEGKAHAKDPDSLASIAYEVVDHSKPFSETSPYDFLKMQVTLQEGPETQWGNVAFRHVTDPRTKFAFPRVTRLGSPVDAGHPANAYLERQHWLLNFNALSCKAKQFKSLGWNSVYPEKSGPDLGGFDEMEAKVEYLSPTIMSWSEHGMIFCGGAHPSSMTSTYTIDVKRGERLDLSRIFRGWGPRSYRDNTIVDLVEARAKPSAYSWGPDDGFRVFLLKKVQEKGPDLPDECELTDMLKDHLEISFKQEDRAVFALSGLPQAISGVCEDPFFEAPLAEFRDFLTPEAGEYFPSLKDP